MIHFPFDQSQKKSIKKNKQNLRMMLLCYRTLNWQKRMVAAMLADAVENDDDNVEDEKHHSN